MPDVRLVQVIVRLERDIFDLKQEIAERDDIITDKEKRILELKRKNQELEKYKFVLEHQVEELKKQDEPREAELLSTQKAFKVMEFPLNLFRLLHAGMHACILHVGETVKYEVVSYPA